jgi:hypothetical protein
MDFLSGFLLLNLFAGLFFWIFLCVAVTVWARKCGRSGTGYFLLSFFLSPLVSGIVLLLRGRDESEIRDRTLRSGTHRICPNCRELILSEAVKCRYCGSTIRPVAPGSMPHRGGHFEWSEISPEEKVGVSLAVVLALFLSFFFIRGMLRGFTGERGAREGAPFEEKWNAPIAEGDRKDGIESLCKVFQIYGLPKNDGDATEAARNAAELFKLPGNHSPERSSYILSTIVGEFRAGKVGQAACGQAGAPLPVTEEGK